MMAAADKLGGAIRAVQAEKVRMDIERRKVQAQGWNQKAQRLVRRLEDCDANIASLLSQAADCLETLVVASVSSSSASQSASVDDSERQRLAMFESRAQDWFSTLHDVQLGLRSAAKNLRKAQLSPVASEVSSRGASSSSGPIAMGSATRGHSLGLALSEDSTPVSLSRRGSNSSMRTIGASTSNQSGPSTSGRGEDAGRISSSSLLSAFVDVSAGLGMLKVRHEDLVDETKLSLSALRQQERGWRQLSGALASVASARKKSRSQGSSRSARSSDTMPSSSRPAQKPTKDRAQREEQIRQIAADLTDCHSSADRRLMGALLNLHMDVLPEISVTPLSSVSMQ